MNKMDRWGAVLVALSYLVFALAFGWVVPPFENLDEIEHFGVVRYIADHGRLPVHGAPTDQAYHYRQEVSQPPLYHALSAAVVRLLDLDAEDAEAFFRFNPRVVCGPRTVGLFDNRAVFYHNPSREAFPWQGTMRMLHLLRGLSTVLQAMTVAGTYALARLAFPRRRHPPLLAMAVVAFNPQFLLVASGVNNDNLVTPLVTVALCLLLWSWRDGLTLPRAAGLGLLAGLAGLSKLSGWLLLPLAGLMTLAMFLRQREGRRKLIIRAALIPAIAMLVGGWWFWRNWQLYGDPTALQPMLKLVGTRSGPIYIPGEAWLMFRSFWGQIPCSFYPRGFYAFYVILTLIGLAGLVWSWRHLERTECVVAAGLAVWFAIVVAAWFRWDAMTPAPGGRLLFPALPAVAALLALGLGALLERGVGTLTWVAIALLAAMALWTVTGILPAFFAPPPRYGEEAAVDPQVPLDATLGDHVGLLGYDLAVPDRAAMDPAGPLLDLTLYWQPLADAPGDYLLALQLVSPVPGDTTLRWNYNSWPGRGNYPTTAWQPGEIIADRYRFSLPEAGFPTQAWDLHLVLYEEGSGERLPVRIDGQPAGDRLVLDRIRLQGQTPSCPDQARLEAEIQFAEAVHLTHAWVVPAEAHTRVLLCWQALQPLPADYQVFVHLLDASHTLVSTGDGPPMQGAFPTSLWQAGDVIADEHRLGVTVQEGTGQHIAVGLYRLEDGTRLPVSVDGQMIANGTVAIWPDPP